MPLYLSIPDERDAVLLHPVSFNYNVATDLSLQLYSRYPDALAQVTKARDIVSKKMSVHALTDDDYIKSMKPNSLTSFTLVHMFCLKDDGTVDRRELRDRLWEIFPKFPSRSIYVPVDMGLHEMDTREWADFLALIGDILESGPNPSVVKTWSY